MKKCPQCNSVYGDEVLYCLNDGTALVEESFTMPSESDSDEPETMIRSEPIIIDLAGNEMPQQAPPSTTYPVVPAENIVFVPAANPAATTRNYALFLILGLLIGGGLVLATLLLSKNLFQSENTNAVKANAANNQANKQTVKVEKPMPSPTIQNKNENVSVEPVANKHAEPNDSFREENANGRVIATNARVRLVPDKDAPVVDTLPIDDRIEILRRENSNSPWYQVECEHGTSGWMHGDTIEFTR
jgi:hypothetical protein